MSKKSLKIAVTSTAKRIKVKQKKFVSLEFVFFSWNESNLDILILTSTQQQNLACWKSMLKYLDDSIEESAGDNLLVDNLLGNNLLGDKNLAHINSNINMDTKAKLNLDKDMSGGNFLEKNFGINIENLFQQVWKQIACKRLTKEVLKQTYNFF